MALNDGDGGRTKKEVYENGSLKDTTTFVGSLYEVTSGSQNAVREHIFLGSTRVATLTNGTVMYYHLDHLGGTNVLTDSDADVKQVIEYDPYGKDEVIVDNLVSTPEQQAWNRFTSHFKDEETGLVYMKARYYMPEIGRFLTPDTFVQAPNDPQSFSRYTYVRNNPINLTDPTGHFFGFIAAIVKTVVSAAKVIASVSATIAKVSAAVSAVTTLTGIATQNQDLLTAGQISGYIGIGASIIDVGLNIIAISSAAKGVATIEGARIAVEQAGRNLFQQALKDSAKSIIAGAVGAISSTVASQAKQVPQFSIKQLNNLNHIVNKSAGFLKNQLAVEKQALSRLFSGSRIGAGGGPGISAAAKIPRFEIGAKFHDITGSEFRNGNIVEFSETKYEVYVKPGKAKFAYACKGGSCGFQPIEYGPVDSSLTVSFSATAPVLPESALHVHSKLQMNFSEFLGF